MKAAGAGLATSDYVLASLTPLRSDR